MENMEKHTSFRGLVVLFLLMAFPVLSPVSAQCPVLVGGSDFYDMAHSDTLWAGDLNLVETVGPEGSKFSSGLVYADSAQAFLDSTRSVYAVTSNPHLLDSTYVDIDQNMLVAHIGKEDEADYKLTKLISYKIGGIDKGSDFTVEFDLYGLNGTKYGIGKTAASWDPYEVTVGIDLDQYGASSCKVSDAFRVDPGTSTHVKLSGTLADGLDYIKLDIIAGYNYVKGMTVGISNLRVKGCYKPHVTSSMGIEICAGEQALISLDKEYNAASYKWFSSTDGSSFKEVGSKKSLYEELKKADASYYYYCLVNGVNSDTIHIKTITCCVDGEGNPMSRMDVFYDDFGYFDDIRSYTDAFGNTSKQPDTYAPERADVTFDLSKTGMAFDPSGQINDGYYGVVVPSPTGYYQDISGNSRATWMSGVSSDHSSLVTGKSGGGALFMNITLNYSDLIFTRQIDGLCTDKNIYFETYIANMSGGTDPEVTINIKDATTGKVLASDKKTATAGAGWIRVHIDELQVSSSSIILEIVSTGTGDYSYWDKGNDLIIDDIRFMVCSPPSIDIYSNLESFASDTVICANTDFTMGSQVSELLTSFFKGQQKYLFQQSTDGKVWNNMGGISDKETYSFNTADYPADTNYFRVVVANADALQKFIADPSDADYDDKCRNYSISKPFKIVRAGAIDMGKDMQLSGCRSDEVELNGSNDGTIVRWSWEDADGNVLVPVSSDEKDKTYTYEVAENGATLYFVGYNKENCVGKRKFTVTEKPLVEATAYTDNKCDSTFVVVDCKLPGATYQWKYEGEELTETGSVLKLDASYPDGTAVVTVSAPDYCDAGFALDAVINKVPDVPVPVKTLMSEQVKAGASVSLEEMVASTEGIEWSVAVDGEFVDSWSTDVPSQSLDDAGTFYYWIRAVSEENCPSDTVRLTVLVNMAPMPEVRNDTVCVGTKIDFSKYILKSDPGFKLLWYNTPDGKGTEHMNSYTATVGGMSLEYWVSQTNGLAESEKAHMTILVATVPKPVTMADLAYCLNAPADELTAVVTEKPGIFSFANGLEWHYGDEVVEHPVPPTDKAGVYEYTVYGTFSHPTTLNGDAVCYSEPATVSVIVRETPVPLGNYTVNYLKSDAADNGGVYKNLVAQNSQVAVAAAGCELRWYDASKTPLNAAPAPDYDASFEGDAEYTYYVSQIDEYGCESELVPVRVTVSSAPMPSTESVAYCEGETAAALTATVNVAGNGDAVDDYTLVWYSENPNEKATDAEKEALELPAAPVPSTVVDNNEPFQIYTYYVAQKRMKDGKAVVSRAAALIDSVYARPVLLTANPDPVCEPATVDLSAANLWSVKAAKVWAKAYNLSSNDAVADPTAVTVSGTYNTQAYFYVRGNQCASEMAPITVQIDYIRDLAIEGASTACPGTTVDLTATTSAISPAEVSYTWTSVEAGETKTVTSADFTTAELPGPASRTYTYTLSASAGACTVTAAESKTITIGDGPVVGSISFSEENNSESTQTAVSANGHVFYSCGSELTIKADVVSTDDDLVWTLNGGMFVDQGSSIKVAPASGTNVYTLTYTNQCPTSFDVTIVSVPVKVVATNTPYNICEGESFEAALSVNCPENTYKVAWFRDGQPLSGESGTSLSLTLPTADDDGVYSYEVTNRGCVVTGEIAEGNALKVRPRILLTYEKEYTVKRDSLLSVPLNITVPAGRNPSTVEWTENGAHFADGNPLSLKVTADHNFKVTLSDDDYCEVEAEIAVKVDARLQLRVRLDETVCAGEKGDLVIDTIGTGKFVYPNEATIVVTETAGGNVRFYTSGWSMGEDGRLHFPVTPASDATYLVQFFYRQPSDGSDYQSLMVEKSIKVLAPVSIIVPDGSWLAICGDGESTLEIELLKVEPENAFLTWDDDPSIVSGLDGRSITVAPTFDESLQADHYIKTYYVRGSYGICPESVYSVNLFVSRPLSGSISAPEVVCEGAVATIDASSYRAEEYLWTSTDDPAADSVKQAVIYVKPEQSASYALTVKRGMCEATTGFNLVVSQSPTIVSVDSLYYNQRDVVVSGGTSPYSYWIDDNASQASSNSTFTKIPYGQHVAYVVDEAGCTAQAPFVVKAPDIKIPVILTPNNDGVNDFFTTDIIREAYPNAVIRIFDRYGKLLATYKGEEQGWDGTYQGFPMKSTDYWYEVEVDDMNKTFTGHFTLMRQ